MFRHIQFPFPSFSLLFLIIFYVRLLAQRSVLAKNSLSPFSSLLHIDRHMYILYLIMPLYI